MREILVVEDDADIREMFAEVLRGAGYVVYEADDGQDALEQLERRNQPCLLLLDVMMPVMNGPTLLQVLKQKNRLSSLQVLALSAADSVHEVGLANGFLAKPVLPEELLRAVKQYCEPDDPRSWVS